MLSGTFDPQTFRKWLIRSSPVKNKGVNEKKNKLTSMEATLVMKLCQTTNQGGRSWCASGDHQISLTVLA